MMKESSLGIYIHIPFCMSKCPYCDFYSIVLHEKSIKDAFLDALFKEIDAFSTDSIIDSIYFGGGTPNLLSKYDINLIISKIYDKFGAKISKNVEISMEYNPKTRENIEYYPEINRISIGAQSFKDKTLKKLGRIHNSIDIYDSYHKLREMGYKNISLDIMFGIPDETIDDFLYDLNEVVMLNPEHISLYSLEFMEGTKFTKLLEEGKLKETDPILDRKMYHEAIKILKSSGYIQYEISNFSKPNYESKHNIKYWDLQEYIGFGPSAHSYVNGKRFKNVESISEYIVNPIDKYVYEELTIDDQIREYTFTALRRTCGINFSQFSERFKVDFWTYFKDSKEELLKYEEYIEMNEKGLKLKVLGFDISNKILSIFV